MATTRAPVLPLLPFLAVLLLAAPLPGQPEGQEPDLAEDSAPSELFLDTVDVDVVNVEVVVTDRSGEPVRGLARDDFVVREDGEPVELTNFYAVQGGRRASPSGESAPGAASEGTGEAEAEAPSPLPDDQRLNLVVLIDNLNITPTSRNRILGELASRLDEVLRPGDRVLVAVANPEVRVIQPFTDDPAAVSTALDRLETTVSRGDMLEAEARLIRREIDMAAGEIATGGGGGGGGFGTGGGAPEDAGRDVLDMIRSWSADRHTQNLRLLGTLERFVEALAGLPGRRAVLYVSEGFSVRPGETLMREWFEVFRSSTSTRGLGVASPESEAAHWDASAEIVRLTEAAAGNHVTFYTLESGSPFPDNLDPEVRQIRSAARTGDILGEGVLADLAWRTGGVPLLNSGNVEALLDRMASDYRDYYSLGYTSPHSNDGEYHRIEVEVPGRRVRVRHTRGFRATTPEQETAERTLSALVFDATDNPLAVQVEVGEEEKEKRNRYVLPVLVRIPISSLTLIPGESSYQGRVSVVVAIRDLDGGLSEPQRMEVPVEIPAERLREAIGLQVAKGVNLLLKEGESTLAVGVRDHLSGTTSTVNVSLSVGDG